MKLLGLFAAVLISASAIAQDNKPVDRGTYNLKGNVKTVTEIVYNAKEKFGDPVKEKKDSKTAYTFNKAGLRSETHMESYTGKWEFTITNKYDNNNRIIEEKEVNEGEVQQAKIKYDAEGRMQEIDVLDKKGRLTAKHKFEYLKEINFSSYDGMFDKRYVYNGEGELTERRLFSKGVEIIENSKGERKSTEIYDFDNKDNVVKIKRYRGKNEKDSTVITYSYNSAKQKTGYSYKEGKSKPTYTDYEYDKYGNVSKEKDSYGTVELYTYTYDAQNNWITRLKKKTSYGETTFEITEREIKYY